MGRLRILIEVAIETVEDALAAERGGADRLELCAALDLGGLTPSLGAFHEIRDRVSLPICVMIRPRPGDFVYDDADFRVMLRDIAHFLPHEPAAFVFGLLRPDGRVDDGPCVELVSRAGPVPCVFHRAFDRVPDQAATLATIRDLGFRRVLTSGQAATALEGSPRIATLMRQAAGRIEILPCGKVRAKDVESVVRVTKCNQVHGSFAEPMPLGEGRGYRGYQQRSRTSAEEVAATRAVLDTMEPSGIV